MTRTTGDGTTAPRGLADARAQVGRIAHLLLALLLAHGLWLAGSAAAGAEGPQDERAAAVPTMLILDASGSMAAKDGDSSGATRMDVAKKAADSLVDQLPEGSQLGLEVYGARTGNSAADKEKGCQDVEVVAPVDGSDTEDLHTGIAGVEASGYTPIGTALTTAAENLPSTGEKSVVLVSDGIDSCAPPDPCEVAEQLHDQGTDITVHTIGFRVDEDARKSLSCIAEATGGTYTDVSDGDQLAAQLAARTTRALQGYQVDGSAVSGGESPGAAPTVDAGSYLDTFSRGASADLGEGQVKYYRIPVKDGERVHASAAVVPPPGDRGFANASDDSHVLFMDARILGDGGQECFGGRDMNIGAANNAEAPVRAYVDSAVVGEAGCEAEDGTLLLSVERGGAEGTDQPLPVEIRVGIQEPGSGASASGSAPEPSDAPSLTPQQPAAQEVALGRSAASAPELEPGTYRVSMVPGDVGMVTVPAQEGQRLSWRLETERAADYDSADLTGNIAEVEVLMLNPLMQAVPDTDASTVTSMVVSEDPQYAEEESMPTPISFTNAEDLSAAQGAPWLGGEQHLQLAMSTGAGSGAAQEPSTFLLTLQVDGTATQSGGSIRTESAAPAAPSVSDDDVSAAQGTGGSASDAGGAAPSEQGSTESAADAGTSGRRTALVVGAVGAGVVALAAVIGLLVLLRRRR